MGLPDACLAHVEGLSFPWLWPKLVMSASVSQSKIFTVVQSTGSYPLQAMIPPPVLSDVHSKSIRFKHVVHVAELLP